MEDTPDQAFLRLCLSKNLLERSAAAEVTQRAQRDGRSVAKTLVAMGLLAQHTCDALAREIAQAQGPKSIAGFRIISKLGQGGMGAVYLAEQVSLHRQVALKVIAPQFSADAQAVERFMREARAAAAINHPNIISVIDVGYDGGQLYMALELVSGGDAAQLAERFNGVLPEARALEIINDCCRGLGALSDARLIHRDIKPANIFITGDGVAKLADLGLARSEQGADRLTVSGLAVGTPAFMSPEQASGNADLDIRSDIYSLGAALFSLTTGSPPFSGNGVYAVAAKLLTQPAPDPRTLNPALSLATARVIARCLAKQPADRYQTPLDLAAAIAEALAAVGSSAGRLATTPVGGNVIGRASSKPAVHPRRPRSAATRRTSRPVSWPIIGGIIAAVVVAAAVGITWTPRSPTPAPSMSAAAGLAIGASIPTANAQPPIISGLIGYWPLDESSGLTARDLTAHASNGAVSNATWGTGKVGGALVFSQPSKVDCGNAAVLSPTAGITVMCWIKTTMVVPDLHLASVLRHDGHFTALQISPDGTAHASVWGGNVMTMADFPWRGVWDDGRWHHYAVTYHRADGVRIYLDGKPYAHLPKITGALPSSPTAPFMLGAAESDSEYFSGSLDEVRVYDHPLTAAEITLLATAPVSH